MINYDYIQYIKYIDYNCIKGFHYEKYVVNKLRDYYDIAEIYLWKDVPDYLLIESGIILSNDLVNVKDKYKQLGAENAKDRIIGEWSLKETVDLI